MVQNLYIAFEVCPKQYEPYQNSARVFYFFLFALFYSKANAQQPADSATYHKNQLYYWGGFHAGTGVYFANIGFDADVLIHNSVVLGLTQNTLFNIPITTSAYQRLNAIDGSFLIGYKLTHRPIHNWTILTGVGVVKIEDRGGLIMHYDSFWTPDTYTPNTFYIRPAIPIQIRYTMAPSSALAMDFSCAVNINAHYSYFSLLYTLAFGKVRSGERPKHPPRQNIPRPGFPPPLPPLPWFH